MLELTRRSRNEPIDWSHLARVECATPQTREDVDELAKSILCRERDFWIVALTARRLEAMPSVAPAAVREIVGPNVPIVFLKSLLATYLSTLLPAKTHVYGGALRVYRPGVTDDPYGHPLLYDPSGEYGEEILEWLGRIFTPTVPRAPVLSPQQRVLVLERELERVTQARIRELAVLRARYEASILGEEDRPSRRRHARLRSLGSGGREPELREEMRRLIDAHWKHLPRRERLEHPLREYTMTPQFLADLRSRVGRVPLDRVAWVCSLVICGFDVGRLGFASGPLPVSGEGSQRTRTDGSNARWCDLRRSSCTPNPRLVYRCCGEGRKELAALGYPPHVS